MSDFVNTIDAVPERFAPRFRARPLNIPKNALFSSLSRQQLRLVLPYIKVRRVKQGRSILEEGARNPGRIYIVLDGKVAVRKEGFSPVEKRVTSYEIGNLNYGDIFGETSFVDGMPSTATFMALSDCAIAVLDLSGPAVKLPLGRVRSIVRAKVRQYLASQARDTTALRLSGLRAEGEFEAYRNGVGHIVVTTLTLLSFYTLMLSFLPSFKNVINANFAVTPLVIVFFALSFVPTIATSGFPLAFFGLGTQNWRPAVVYALRVSGIFIAVVLGIKLIMLHTFARFSGLSLVDGADIEVGGQAVSSPSWYGLAVATYLLLTPMQEFAARSGIQAPLYAFLHGSETKRRWVAILVSNFVFCAVHAHISVAFAIFAFAPGLLWGWIFARTNSLLAATASHIVIGGAGIFIFGVEAIVSRFG